MHKLQQKCFNLLQTYKRAVSYDASSISSGSYVFKNQKMSFSNFKKINVCCSESLTSYLSSYSLGRNENMSKLLEISKGCLRKQCS